MKHSKNEYTREDLDRLYFLAHGLDGNTTVAELNAKLEATIAAGKWGSNTDGRDPGLSSEESGSAEQDR